MVISRVNQWKNSETTADTERGNSLIEFIHVGLKSRFQKAKMAAKKGAGFVEKCWGGIRTQPPTLRYGLVH